MKLFVGPSKTKMKKQEKDKEKEKEVKEKGKQNACLLPGKCMQEFTSPTASCMLGVFIQLAADQ